MPDISPLMPMHQDPLLVAYVVTNHIIWTSVDPFLWHIHASEDYELTPHSPKAKNTGAFLWIKYLIFFKSKNGREQKLI